VPSKPPFKDGDTIPPPHCPSLDPRRTPHAAYVFGAAFTNMHGQRQVLAFKTDRERQMFLTAARATAVSLLALPGGVYPPSNAAEQN
jgi:hypothetical protein